MRRLLRASGALALLFGLFALVADASETNAPTISNLSSFVVSGGTRLTVAGDHLSSDLPGQTGDCSIHGGPTVRFYPYNSPGHLDADPLGTDASNCSNSFVNVSVPQALTGAARVSVIDYHGQESNTGPGGFFPIVTVQPVASLNPAAGQVGTTVTIQGSNFQPPSLAPGAALRLSIGSAARSGNWGPGSITFSPGNSSGEVQASFKVSTDSGDPGNPSKQVTVLVDAGNYSFLPPSLEGASLGRHVVGDRLTLSGHNLGSSGSVLFPGGMSGQGITWDSNSIDVTVPAGAQPGEIAAYVNGFGSIAGPSISLDPRPGGLTPNAASANQAVTLSGYNFGAATGSVAVGSAPQAVTSWADQRVTFTVSGDADGGAVTLTRPDGAAVALGALAVLPHLDRVETASVPAGSQVVVDGVSLGAAQGRATVGAMDAPTLLWSRSSVLIQLPVSLGVGTYPVVLTSASGAASNPVNLTIVPASTPQPPPGRPAKPTGIGGALAPSFDNNHSFVKPIKPPSPVYFNLSVDPHRVKAGDAATLVVTLKLNDKPVQGAAVKLSMLFTPGNDYRFTPDSGVTDADGTFKAAIQTSKNPGDTIIAATSGVFSDQDHVTGSGTAPPGAPTQSNPASQAGGFAPLVALGVAAVALVAAGFYLNIRSMAS